MIKYFGLVLFVTSAVYSSVSETENGSENFHCLKLNSTLLTPVDLERLQGSWYKVAMVGTPVPIKPFTACNKMVATYNAHNNTLLVKGYNYANRNSKQYLGYIQTISHNPKGVGLIVNSPGWENQFFAILTDYEHYAIAYTCVERAGHYYDTIVYIGGPTENFNEKNYRMGMARLAQVGIHAKKWDINNSTDC